MAPSEQRDLNNFLMDLKNWVLQHRWDARIGIPCGPRRHGREAPAQSAGRAPARSALDHLWGEIMREELADYPRRTYEEYCGWVENGGGDEYFQPSEPDPAYVEAQAKQRTAYLCTETVMPLEVSLYDRIVPLALASLRSAAPVNGCAEASDNLR